MKRHQRLDPFPRRGLFRSVSEPWKWLLFLWVWLVTWTPGLFLLIGWQVSLFILVPFCVGGIGLFLFIMGHYVRASLQDFKS